CALVSSSTTGCPCWSSDAGNYLCHRVRFVQEKSFISSVRCLRGKILLEQRGEAASYRGYAFQHSCGSKFIAVQADCSEIWFNIS
ncbi:hypothetical protein BGT96224_174, partial [Blumeria graminis f. sp. tritici 96224]